MPVRKYFTELALNSYCSFAAILQQDSMAQLRDAGFDTEHPCHIYIIARRPRISIDPDATKVEGNLFRLAWRIQRGEKFESHSFTMVHSGKVDHVETEYPYSEFKLFGSDGKLLPSGKAGLVIPKMDRNLGGKHQDLFDLEVLYVGQSYGAEGARTAPERLLSHATLQGIYAEAMRRSPDQEIWLILCSFDSEVVMTMDGTAKSVMFDGTDDDEHRDNVLKKGITEQQHVNYVEAALIRYFRPEYNVTLKDTFPSPAHATYSECYDLDLCQVSVVLDTEELGYRLKSPAVQALWTHVMQFPLHSPEERKSMFDFGFSERPGET